MPNHAQRVLLCAIASVIAAVAHGQAGPPMVIPVMGGALEGSAPPIARETTQSSEPSHGATRESAHERLRYGTGDENSRPLGAPGAIDTPQETRRVGASSSSLDGGGGVGRTVAALAGVLGMIVVIAAIIRKVSRQHGGLSGLVGPGGKAPSGVVYVLARYPLGGGQTLILLKIERRILLLCSGRGRGVSSPTMATLAEFTDPEDVASLVIKTRDQEGESISSRFRSLLGRFDGAHQSAMTRPAPESPSPTRSRVETSVRPMSVGFGEPAASMRSGHRVATKQTARTSSVAPTDRAAEALRARLAAARRAA